MSGWLLHLVFALGGGLGAVARYATGGIRALEKQGGDSAKLLLQQLQDREN